MAILLRKYTMFLIIMVKETGAKIRKPSKYIAPIFITMVMTKKAIVFLNQKRNPTARGNLCCRIGKVDIAHIYGVGSICEFLGKEFTTFFPAG
eukprot:8713106-Ditylum_brightwellii.AAC.1